MSAAPMIPGQVRQGYAPLPGDGLQQVFQHLWTRLQEAETRAVLLKHTPPDCAEHAGLVDALVSITNVRAAYRHIADLLATATAAADAREKDLRAQLADAQRDNHQLREQLREVRA